MLRQLTPRFIAATLLPLVLASASAVTAHAQELLTWAPPVLNNPETVTVTNSNPNPTLSAGKDYIIEINEKITQSGGVTINGNGARNIVVIGGEIEVPNAGPYTTDPQFDKDRQSLTLKNWTGTCHIEGLLIHGPDIAEGIVVDSRNIGCILQVQNVRVGPLVSRQEEKDNEWVNENHPDIIQFYGGPTYLFVDHLTGYTDYQGFMMQPHQFAIPGTEVYNYTELADFRNIDLHQTTGAGGYVLFWAGSSIPSIKAFNLEDVWVEPRETRWAYFPEDTTVFQNVNIGTPPTGNFVPLSVPGVNYTSPGYMEQTEGPTQATWLGGTGSWVDSANWSDGTVPGSTSTTDSTDKAIFAANGDGTVTVDPNRNLQYLDFNDGGSAYVLSGGFMRLTDAGVITVHSGTGGDIQINNPLELQGGFSFINDSTDRSIAVSGDITTAATASTLILGGSATTYNTIDGGITLGNGGITKSGDGMWVLEGTNSFSGRISLNAGALRVANSDAFGGSEGGIRIEGLTGALTRLELSGGVTVPRNIDTAGSRWFDPTQVYGHVVNVSGDNTLAGYMRINGSGGQGVAFESLAGKLTIAGDLQHNYSGTRTWGFAGAGDFEVTGALEDRSSSAQASVGKTGSGTLTISGTSKGYTGPTRVYGGTLLVETTIGTTAATTNQVTVGTTGTITQGSTATLGGTGNIRSGQGVVIGHAGSGETPGAPADITAATVGTVGQMNILSNVTFLGADGGFATYVADVDASSSDLLNITGDLDLTSAYDALEINASATGADSYTLVQVTGTLSGTFDHVSGTPAGYEVVYGTTSVTLVKMETGMAYGLDVISTDEGDFIYSEDLGWFALFDDTWLWSYDVDGWVWFDPDTDLSSTTRGPGFWSYLPKDSDVF